MVKRATCITWHEEGMWTAHCLAIAGVYGDETVGETVFSSDGSVIQSPAAENPRTRV